MTKNGTVEVSAARLLELEQAFKREQERKAKSKVRRKARREKTKALVEFAERKLKEQGLEAPPAS